MEDALESVLSCEEDEDRRRRGATLLVSHSRLLRLGLSKKDSSSAVEAETREAEKNFIVE